ncbi:GNAT family N-acetyltransferase [Caenimonas koreensis]|uniref:GNAT family N-acetyltransferase n=1 Tax=Caenimonas koreensis DSM 17982 TaxID=1121255 RepID=A0A844AR95_9BURK|nr:GNAT family N-acetyltransferase [Caenimonas koreensis]MRD46564.1 GNAT family N-acetyltransferase [Caenimonas koreensis DSM 17982]
MDTAHQADANAIVIRSAEPSDAAAISNLLGQVGTFEGLLQTPDFPEAGRMEFLQKIEPHACRLVAVAGDKVVGNAGLHLAQMSLRRFHVRYLGIGVHPQWQGRGVGRQLIARLVDWADNWANVLRIELHVHADNDRARALYESFGFFEEGRHKAYALKNGRFVDCFSMARLHPNAPRITD